jgi:hypothetical protein
MLAKDSKDTRDFKDNKDEMPASVPGVLAVLDVPGVLSGRGQGICIYVEAYQGGFLP